jgi:uncharacterized protein (TIGR02118 family)
MYKIVAFWSAPKKSEVEAFEKYYADVHVPLAALVPGLRKLELMKVDSGIEGAAAPFYRVAELTFDNAEDMKLSSGSAQWRAMRVDAGKMLERFEVTLTVGAGTTIDVLPQ